MYEEWGVDCKIPKLIKIEFENEIINKGEVPEHYISVMYKWIHDVVLNLQFKSKTYKNFLYYNSVELVEKYINNENSAKCILQLICIVAINLMLKMYDDEFHFSNTEISKYTGNVYFTKEIHIMESNMLKYAKIKLNDNTVFKN